MKLVYVDSSVWIAYVEGYHSYQALVEEELHALIQAGSKLCLSDAVFLEVLNKPHQEKQQELLTSYHYVFKHIHRLNTYEDIFRDALQVGETDHLKGLDAVHVAFAVKYACELFITTDPDFRTLKSLPLLLIDLSSAAPA